MFPLKENNTDYTIKWSIIKNSISYTEGSKRCNLCLEEKLSILKEKSKYLLNKRSEIVSACHHKNKFQVNHLKIKKKQKKNEWYLNAHMPTFIL